jgi:hypothetical protein
MVDGAMPHLGIRVLARRARERRLRAVARAW